MDEHANFGQEIPWDLECLSMIWPFMSWRHCYLRNIQDLPADGKTPYERRIGEPLKGSIIPFGAMVENHPISAKDQSTIHQFGKKVAPGISPGYELVAGGIWKGDILRADLEDFGKVGCIAYLSSKIQRERSIDHILNIADGTAKL